MITVVDLDGQSVIIMCEHGRIGRMCPWCAGINQRTDADIMAITTYSNYDYELPHMESKHHMQKRQSREKIFNKRQSNKPWSY